MEKGTLSMKEGNKQTNNQGKIKGRKMTISSKAEYSGEVPENPVLLIKRRQLTPVSYHLVFRWKNKSQYLKMQPTPEGRGEKLESWLRSYSVALCPLILIPISVSMENWEIVSSQK